MGRKSTIKRLPKPIRAAVDQLLADNATIDEVVTHLKSMGATVSSSAVGRYRKSFEQVAKKLRESREVAEVWVAEIGSEPEGDVGRLAVDIIRTLTLQVAIEAGERPDVDTKELGQLARAIKDLEIAAKTGIDREAKVRELLRQQVADAARQTAEKVVAAATKGGLSRKTADEIYRDILGIGSDL